MAQHNLRQLLMVGNFVKIPLDVHHVNCFHRRALNGRDSNQDDDDEDVENSLFVCSGRASFSFFSSD